MLGKGSFPASSILSFLNFSFVLHYECINQTRLETVLPLMLPFNCRSATFKLLSLHYSILDVDEYCLYIDKKRCCLIYRSINLFIRRITIPATVGFAYTIVEK